MRLPSIFNTLNTHHDATTSAVQVLAEPAPGEEHSSDSNCTHSDTDTHIIQPDDDCEFTRIESELAHESHHQHGNQTKLKAALNFLSLTMSGIGVVYGDLATSPLYTYPSIFSAPPDLIENLGACSLIIYSLLFVISFKYGIFMLEMDNKGEGGLLALTELIPNYELARDGRFKSLFRVIIVILSIMGTALFIATAVITAPVSVLSAIEGLKTINASMDQAVVPISCGILIALFAVQRFGTAKVGMLFGPILLLWCATISGTGIYNITRNTEALKALNPMYMYYLFERDFLKAFRMAAGVILVLSGAEAMYGDLGHFGKGPLRVSWYFVACPSIIICYLGQTAFIIDHPESYHTVFYTSLPTPVYWPVFVLATLATIIASQAMITGTFSLLKAAMSLNYFPNMKVYYTSDHAGQIYIPFVNWGLLVGCIALSVGFGDSADLADAFGLSVALVLLITTLLYIGAILTSLNRVLWLRITLAVLSTIAFLPIMIFFTASNCLKFLHDGYIPIIISAIFFIVMLIWWRGEVNFQQLGQNDTTSNRFQNQIENIVRIDDTIGVFYIDSLHVPDYVQRYVQLLHMLPQVIILLHVKQYPMPYVKESHRFTKTQIGENMYQITARYGFKEQVNVPNIIKLNGFYVDDSVPESVELPEITSKEVLPILAAHVAYYVPGYVLKVDKTQWFYRRVLSAIYIFMRKNSLSQYNAWKIPTDLTIELGTIVHLN